MREADKGNQYFFKIQNLKTRENVIKTRQIRFTKASVFSKPAPEGSSLKEVEFFIHRTLLRHALRDKTSLAKRLSLYQVH